VRDDVLNATSGERPISMPRSDAGVYLVPDRHAENCQLAFIRESVRQQDFATICAIPGR